jgi:allantoin racemase
MPAKIKIGYVMGTFSDAARERRLNAVRSRADESIELHVMQVDEPMELRNWTPEDTLVREAAFVAAFRRAQDDGCDAVVPDGMLDLGVEAGRSAVHIPVVAPFEAAIHVAACVGTRVGIIQYTSAFVPAVWAKVRKYGVTDLVVAVAALDVEMVDLEAQRDAVGAQTVALGRKLVAEHAADVIIPTGPGLCPVTLDPAWLGAQIGVPVVEGIGAPIQMAAALVRLGLTQSPVRWPPARHA